MNQSTTFVDVERARAEGWKQSTSALPEAAREPAAYIRQDGKPTEALHDFCLPSAYARWSLLPDVRDIALDLFAELEIPWHAGIDGGPSNHLLSSQVQCVNALARMVTDPARLVGAFAGPLGTVDVLHIEPGRYLTFEYIGPTDFFGEAPHGLRTRGANCTSVDAAFVHRLAGGITELVLLEWKYTESYRRRYEQPAKDAVRRKRYGPSYTDPAGPLRSDLVELDHLLGEPFYQLMRQQLLAWRLEEAGAHGGDRVRVVHVCPQANTAYQTSIHDPALLPLGSTVGEIWSKLLRTPDRFCSLDPSVFADPAITSLEYAARYATRHHLSQ